MTGYALFLVAATLLFVASNYSGAIVAWLGGAIFFFGLILRGRLWKITHGYDVPLHRRRLDHLVVAQWGVAGVGTLAVGLLSHPLAYRPLAHANPFVHALVIGGLIISSGVFLSSLIDWYWILPRLAGLGGYSAPCEDSGSEQ